MQFAAATALCTPLTQGAVTTSSIREGEQLPAASAQLSSSVGSPPTAAASASVQEGAQPNDQEANAGDADSVARPAAGQPSAQASLGARIDATGLAVLIRVLSSPRATANPTHVYMLLRLLDAASKLKVHARAWPGGRMGRATCAADLTYAGAVNRSFCLACRALASISCGR